jgi:cytochrome c556
MKGTVKPNNEAIKKALEAGPADDEAWAALALNAGLLNEASYTLMDDGRCPDGVWADAATKNLRQASVDLLKAIEGKNLDAAKAAAAGFGKSCKGCHDAHKKKAK